MSNKPTRNRGLGRGLSALMADVPSTAAGPEAAPRRADMFVPIEQVMPNPDQPRRTFEDTALEDLAASIREKGIIQPIIVRTAPSDSNKYEIVAGERRWRAAQLAQLHELPVLVREFDDTEVLEVAIIENIQRADLNAVDEAAGYKALMERFGHTQDQLSQVLGKSRSHIANHLRLLTLPESVLRWLAEGKLSAGHARALVGQDNAETLARQIIDRKMSVRDAEKLVKAGNRPETTRPTSKSGKAAKDADTLQIQSELTAQLGMPVSIDHAGNAESGKLTINYKSLDQLDDLMRLLAGG